MTAKIEQIREEKYCKKIDVEESKGSDIE